MVLSKPLFKALGFYFSQLYENPVRTKAISFCVIATAGNYTAQALAGTKGGVDYQSLVSYGLFGLFFGGTIPHYFGELMERMIPEEASLVTLKNLFFERLIFSPLYHAFTLYTLSRLEGKSHKRALNDLSGLFLHVLTTSWKYVTVLQLLNYSVVPPMLRIFVNNLIGFFWTVYIFNARRAQASKGKKKSN